MEDVSDRRGARVAAARRRTRRSLTEGWAEALLDQRARFHVALRVTTRLDRWLRVFTGPQPRANLGRLTAATGASIALDVASGAALRSGDGFALGPRLATDVLDTTAWSLAEGSTYDRAVLTGVPLAVEAGGRLDAAGLVVPAVGVAVTSTARRLRGWPARPQTFLWQVAGVALGAALARHERRHRAVVSERASRRREARRAQARLDGQAAVAMTADNVVDALANAGWRISPDGGARVGQALRAWKAELAERTRADGRASFLSTALHRWQRAHNVHPDLSSDVELDYVEAAPPVVLTSAQVDLLHRALDRAGLRGRVTVRVLDQREAQLPSRPRHLEVGDLRLVLPADRLAEVEPFDPTVAVGALAAIWYGSTVAGNLGGVPVASVAPAVAGSIATVPLLVAVRRRHGRTAEVALAAHAAVGLVHAVLATRTMRPTGPGGGAAAAAGAEAPADELTGVLPHPWAPALGVVALTGALVWDELDGPARAGLVAAAAAMVGAGLVADRLPVRWAQLPVAVAGPAAAWWATRGLAQRLASETDELDAVLEAQAEHAVDEAFADGRSSVISVASSARFEIWRLLRERADDLDDDLEAVVVADLRRADAALAEL